MDSTLHGRGRHLLLIVHQFACYHRFVEICGHVFTCCWCLHIHKAWRQEVEMVCHNTIHCCNMDSGYSICGRAISQRLWNSKRQRILYNKFILSPIHWDGCLTYCGSHVLLECAANLLHTHFHVHKTKMYLREIRR